MHKLAASPTDRAGWREADPYPLLSRMRRNAYHVEEPGYHALQERAEIVADLAYDVRPHAPVVALTTLARPA